MKQTKYLFVMGGVMSGVGKGATTAAIGRILKSKGFEVTAMKIDPYVNVDAGTMNPIEHGEVFVTIDGDETDQDMGNYERFLDVNMTRDNYMTTGRVYQSVIERERNLEYGGRCVEVVPHVPEEVINRIETAAEKTKADFVLIEIGGTVGEYQNILFLEALRMMKMRSPNDVRSLLVSYLPIPSTLGEMKTKPTQHAVREVNRVGITVDFLVCRAKYELDEPRREKLATFCSVKKSHIISAPNVHSIYSIPQYFENQGLGDALLDAFGMKKNKTHLTEWNKMAARIESAHEPVNIGVIGKYFSTGDYVLSDVYISVLEAIKHAAWANNRQPEIHWINSEDFEKDPNRVKELNDLDGIVIPGGFGTRGIEGKILAIKHARENKIPYFGLCYGMQCAVIEFARNVLGWTDANTEEMDPETHHLMIHFMEGQRENAEEAKYGGTLRLGSWPCHIKPHTIAAKAYGTTRIEERHRHRYEFNNEHREALELAGLVISGESPDGNLVEMIEIENHPFFIGVQFHPEFQSRPLTPHPLFVTFIRAAI